MELAQQMRWLVFILVCFGCSWLLAMPWSAATAQEVGSRSGDRLAAIDGDATSLRVEGNVVFRDVQGQKLLADVYRPDSEDTLPGVIMIHGGAWIAGDKWHVVDHARRLAKAGFVVMAINYRLSPAVQWPAQWDDCREALRWLIKHADEWKVDSQRLATWGYSAGGQLSLMMALDQPADLPRIKACVAGGSPCDLAMIPPKSRVLAAFLGGSREEVPERYRDASPITRLSRDDPPLFFFHGERDALVPLDNARQAYLQARQVGIPAEFLEAPALGHLMTFLDARAREKAIDFLRAQLHAGP
jgi:acetyl esterase/lipase